MKRPITAVIAFGLTAAFLTFAALMPDDDFPIQALLALGCVVAVTAAVGAFIGYRRPQNNVGWVLVLIGLSLSAGMLATQYANRALVDAPGSLPAGIVAAWLQTWLWSPLVALFSLLLLYFPTGAPPSPRWRIVERTSTAVAALLVVSLAFRPGPFETFPAFRNPLGVRALAPLQGILEATWGPVLLLIFGAAIASIVVRFRRSRGVERQQLKYFGFAVAAGVPLVLLNPLLTLTSATDETIAFVAFALLGPLIAFLLLPLAIGLAILRTHLFDIDRIISRTLAYAVVTAMLAGAFAILVLVPTAVVGRGGGDTPDYVIAGATLIVAALFRPLRRSIQTRLDRRFNRARYDAARIVEGFSARLRQQIDIDALGAQLRAVVVETVHPEHTSVWIAKGP
jgi:hypothetical protein